MRNQVRSRLAMAMVAGLALGTLTVAGTAGVALAGPTPAGRLAAAQLSPAACGAYENVALSEAQNPQFVQMEKQLVQGKLTSSQEVVTLTKFFSTKAGYNLERQTEAGFLKFFHSYGGAFPASEQGDVRTYVATLKRVKGLSFSQYKSILTAILNQQSANLLKSSGTPNLKNEPSWLRNGTQASERLGSAIISACAASGGLTPPTT